MTKFKCTKCGKIYKKKGTCKDCKVVLTAICPYCGYSTEFCTCEVPSTKAHKPR